MGFLSRFESSYVISFLWQLVLLSLLFAQPPALADVSVGYGMDVAMSNSTLLKVAVSAAFRFE